MNGCIEKLRAGNGQRGVTLVELLVSLALGLLLTAGIIRVFAGNRVTYAFTESLSRIQENARFSLDHMAYTTRMAGYSGCLSDVAVHNNLNDAGNAFKYDIENGVQGYDANGTGVGETFAPAATNPAPPGVAANWSPALPDELKDVVIAGSDVLVVRGISGSANGLVTPFSDSAQVFVAPSHGFLTGEILVSTDCQKASIFQVTQITIAGPTKVNVVHSNASATPGNATPVWGPEQSYGLGSEVARLENHAFYVGVGDNGSPALFQLRLGRVNGTTSDFAAEELVSDIETLQVRYGLDTNGDGAIDDFVSADAVGNWTNVLSVEMSLVGRASNEYGTDIDTATYDLAGMVFNPLDDRRFRQVFSTTVGVRNRLP
jgi:type IV pilus assembly protein PilW